MIRQLSKVKPLRHLFGPVMCIQKVIDRSEDYSLLTFLRANGWRITVLDFRADLYQAVRPA